MHFAGLWWTVRLVAERGLSGLWFAASFAVRVSLVLAALVLAARTDLLPLAAAALGFLAARVLTVRLLTARIGRTEESTRRVARTT